MGNLTPVPLEQVYHTSMTRRIIGQPLGVAQPDKRSEKFHYVKLDAVVNYQKIFVRKIMCSTKFLYICLLYNGLICFILTLYFRSFMEVLVADIKLFEKTLQTIA